MVSILVKGGALVCVLALAPQFSIDLQLIGGVLILQTLPALVLGLWKTFAHRWALLVGWAVGMVAGLVMVYDTPNPATGKEHFGGAQYALSNFGIDTEVTLYTGLIALAANLLIVVTGSFVLRALKAPEGTDETRSRDYESESRGDWSARPLPASAQERREEQEAAEHERVGTGGS